MTVVWRQFGGSLAAPDWGWNVYLWSPDWTADPDQSAQRNEVPSALVVVAIERASNREELFASKLGAEEHQLQRCVFLHLNWDIRPTAQ